MNTEHRVSATVARQVARQALDELAAARPLREDGDPSASPHFWTGRLSRTLERLLTAEPDDGPDVHGATAALDQVIRAACTASSMLRGEPAKRPAPVLTSPVPARAEDVQPPGYTPPAAALLPAGPPRSAGDMAFTREHGFWYGSVHCPALAPGKDGGTWQCTLRGGHEGRHEAHGASPLPIWDDYGPVETSPGHDCDAFACDGEPAGDDAQ